MKAIKLLLIIFAICSIASCADNKGETNNKKESVDKNIEPPITEFAGVKFGTDYETAKKQLENKFGNCIFAERKIISFADVYYCGCKFSNISACFEYDTKSSYFCGVILMSAPSKDESEAKTSLDKIKSEIEKERKLNVEKNDSCWGGYSYYWDDKNVENKSKDDHEIQIFPTFWDGEYSFSMLYGGYSYTNEHL